LDFHLNTMLHLNKIFTEFAGLTNIISGESSIAEAASGIVRVEVPAIREEN
jgi:hypothetical protein